MPVSTRPTGTVPIPPILYTSWRGSLRGLSVGLVGGMTESRASSRVIPLALPSFLSTDHPLYQDMFSERKEGKASGMTLLGLLTLSFPPPGPLTSPSGCPSRMSTKSEVLEQSPWVVWRPASLSPAWSSPSPPTCCPLRSSPWRCTTSLSPRLSPETTLASTSRTSPSRTSREDTSPPTPRTSPPPVCLTLPPRSLSSTTPDRSLTATAPSLIATPLTLLASLPRSRRRLTAVPVSQLRTIPSSSSLETPPSSC